MTIARITELARVFRSVLEHTDPEHLPITLRSFPHGACGDAALLLAKFLEQHGHRGFGYMLGSRGEWSHAWLQRGLLVVDITADQFDDVTAPVIVSTCSDWHAALNGKAENSADFTQYDARTSGMLAAAYERICALLPDSSRP